METCTSVMNLSKWESLYKIEVEDLSHFNIKEIGRMRRCGYHKIKLDKNLMLYIALNKDVVLETLSKENKKENMPKPFLTWGEYTECNYAPNKVDVFSEEWVDSYDKGEKEVMNYIN